MSITEVTTKISPRLVVSEPDKAIKLYQEVMGAKLLERFTDQKGIVVHAALQIGESILSLTQQVPEWRLMAPDEEKTSPVLLHLTLPDPDKIGAMLVDAGGEILVPIEDRPYGKREGRIRDPFGHLWILSRPIESVSAEQIQSRLSHNTDDSAD